MDSAPGLSGLVTSLRMRFEGGGRSECACADRGWGGSRMRPWLAGVFGGGGSSGVGRGPWKAHRAQTRNKRCWGSRGDPWSWRVTCDLVLRTEASGWTGVARRPGSRIPFPGRGPAHPRTLLFGVRPPPSPGRSPPPLSRQRALGVPRGAAVSGVRGNPRVTAPLPRPVGRARGWVSPAP